MLKVFSNLNNSVVLFFLNKAGRRRSGNQQLRKDNSNLVSSKEREARSIKRDGERTQADTGQDKDYQTEDSESCAEAVHEVRVGSIHVLISEEPEKSCCFTWAWLGQAAGVQLALACLTLRGDDCSRTE